MKQFNVSRRLVGLIGSFGVVTMLAVIAFTLLLRHTASDSAAVAKESSTQLGESYQLLETLSGIHGDIQGFLRLKDPDEMESALKQLETHRTSAAQMIAKTQGTQVAAIKQQYEAMLVSENEVTELVLQGGVADAYNKFFSVASKQYDSLLKLLHEHNQAVAQAATGLLATHQAGAERAMQWQTVIVATILAGLLAFGWHLKTQIVRELDRTARNIAESSAQLAHAVAQLTTSSQSLAEGASEQAASLEETSASLEEMSSMTQRNAGNAQQAKDLAKQARDAAEHGVTDMQGMSQAMNDIKASSDDIAKIIKTIDEIAFQTNLLALNAAVEAARAGEAGMGFAVVADEVRNLAQRSAQAAKDTAGKIEGAITKSALGVSLNAQVAQVLGEIVTKVRQVDELVAEVATASSEQSNGIVQVNAAVGQMDKVTQANAAGAEESAAAAGELNAQAHRLETISSELQKLIGSRTKNLASTAKRPARALHAPQGHVTPKVGMDSGNNGASEVGSTASTARSRRSPGVPSDSDFEDFEVLQARNG